MKERSKQLALELAKELKKIFPDKEFIIGVLSFASTDEDRLELLEYIRNGENVSVETVSVLSLNLHDKHKE